MDKKKAYALNLGAHQQLQEYSAEKKPSWILFAVLVALYLGTTYFVQLTARSEDMIFIGSEAIPLRQFTGAISGISNLSVIFLTFLYKKPGFIVALLLLVVQVPVLAVGLFIRKMYQNISGFSTNVLIIVSMCLIFFYTAKTDKIRKEMQKQAITDRLTGLPNRFACTLRLEELVRRDKHFALAIIDLNNFKAINNALGQAAGNAILVEVARRLKKAADNDTTDTVNYLTYNGGDEFAVILQNNRNDAQIAHAIAYFQNALKEKITVNGGDYFVTARAGYAEYPVDAGNDDELYSCALNATAKAKDSKDRNRICRYDRDMQKAETEIETERKIREALKEHRMCFALQPQFDLNHKIRGFEALARLRDRDGTMISPAEFIPVAERTELIDKIDYAVFRGAAGFIGRLIQQTNAEITLCVNVSVRHLMKNDFIQEVNEIIKTSGIPARLLEFEITESIMIDSVEEAINTIEELKMMGVKVAIDDFGTGYSSLSYLNKFPADVLKVDKSFIDKLNSGLTHKKYVAAIISFGHVMHFHVIAEGVETSEQLEILRNIGCDYIQGFYWGRPMPPEEAEKLVRQSV